MRRQTIIIDGPSVWSAAQQGNLETVKKLIEAGADVNQTRAGCVATPLSYAAENGHLEVVKALLKAGAKVYGCLRGFTPLYLAAGNGHLEVVQALIEAGADVNHNDRALYIAACRDHLEVVQALLKAGAKVDQVRAYTGDYTPLFVAAQKGHVEVVQALIGAGANLNQTDGSGGATSLFIAAYNGHLEVVQALLKAGAKVDQAHATEGTPLYIAAQKGHFETAKALLIAGADVTAISSDERFSAFLADAILSECLTDAALRDLAKIKDAIVEALLAKFASSSASAGAGAAGVTETPVLTTAPVVRVEEENPLVEFALKAHDPQTPLGRFLLIATHGSAEAKASKEPLSDALAKILRDHIHVVYKKLREGLLSAEQLKTLAFLKEDIASFLIANPAHIRGAIEAANPSNPLGKFFYLSRGVMTADINRGQLKVIADYLRSRPADLYAYIVEPFRESSDLISLKTFRGAIAAYLSEQADFWVHYNAATNMSTPLGKYYWVCNDFSEVKPGSAVMVELNKALAAKPELLVEKLASGEIAEADYPALAVFRDDFLKAVGDLAPEKRRGLLEKGLGSNRTAAPVTTEACAGAGATSLVATAAAPDAEATNPLQKFLGEEGLMAFAGMWFRLEQEGEEKKGKKAELPKPAPLPPSSSGGWNVWGLFSPPQPSTASQLCEWGIDPTDVKGITGGDNPNAAIGDVSL